MSKWRQKGGGFIGRIESVTFEAKTWESDAAKNGSYRTLTAKLMVLKDGADEAIQQFANAGFLYDGQGVSKNGKTLTDKNSADAPIVDGSSNFARLIDTIEESGFDSKPFEKTNYRNYEALEGQRFEFRQELDKERQIASGLKKLKAKKNTTQNEDGTFTIKGVKVPESEVMEAGKRIGKTGDAKGKKFNQNRLIVVKVLGDAAAAEATDDAEEADEDEAEEEEAAPKAKAGKGKKVAEPEEDEDEAEEADDKEPSNKEAIKLLKEILDDEDGEISQSDLTLLVARKIKDRKQRDAMTKKLFSTEFLEQENGWSFNSSSKKKTIKADE